MQVRSRDRRAECGIMGRRGGLAVNEASRAELERLSRAVVRGEAGGPRAVLWSLARETSAPIAARLGVRAEQVRRWRASFRSGGVAALPVAPPAGPAAAQAGGGARCGLRGAGGLRHRRPARTLARLAREIGARTGETVAVTRAWSCERGLPLAPAGARA